MMVTKQSDFVLLKRDMRSQPTQHPEQLKKCAQMAAEVTQRRDDQLAITFLFTLFMLFQACMSVTEYSGSQKPPMYGDFEAQRHWMELTVNLPISQWYSYDLDYWGLDYPPLTAYHSWLLGRISMFFNATWTELDSSRGIEQPEHKLFMRMSVIVTMMALYAPALIILQMGERKKRGPQSDQFWLLLLAQSLLYPGLLFVDCSHFQYNHCSLGLFLWSLVAFHADYFYIGSAMFVLALNHKQMELYHALPIAVFLLARSIRKLPNIWYSIGQSLFSLFRLALVVFGTFLFLWFPFLFSGHANAFQVLKRLFPVNRGLFEDKVANFWCSASLLIKFKELYSISVLLKISTFLVLSAAAPTLLCLFLRPNKTNFHCALVSSALGFFLFSFQVHEKSILLVAVPALLLLNDAKLRRPTGLFLSISGFSLYPLCLKDGAPEILPLFIFYHIFIIWTGQQLMASTDGNIIPKKNKLLDFIEIASLPIILGLCLLQLLAYPPVRYPHLFPLLNALFSFTCFVGFWLWLNLHILARNFENWIEQKVQKKKRQ